MLVVVYVALVLSGLANVGLVWLLVKESDRNDRYVAALVAKAGSPAAAKILRSSSPVKEDPEGDVPGHAKSRQVGLSPR